MEFDTFIFIPREKLTTVIFGTHVFKYIKKSYFAYIPVYVRFFL